MQINKLSETMERITTDVERMNDLFSKSRDYTADETKEMVIFRNEVKEAAQEMRSLQKSQFEGMSDASVVMVGFENKVGEAVATVKKLNDELDSVSAKMKAAQAESDKLASRMSYLQEQRQAVAEPAVRIFTQQMESRRRLRGDVDRYGRKVEEFAPVAEQAKTEREQAQTKVEQLKESLSGRMTPGKVMQARSALGTSTLNPAKLRKMAKEAVPGAEEDLQKARETEDLTNSELAARTKILETKKGEYEAMDKAARSSVKDLKTVRERVKEFDVEIKKTEKQQKIQADIVEGERNRRKELRKQIVDSEENLKTEEKRKTVVEKTLSLGRRRMEEERRSRVRETPTLGLLEAASEMNIPGVSQAATVAKYARRSAAAAEPETPPQGLGGQIMAGLGRGAGLMKGGLIGAGLVAGGYGMLQGYRMKQMAPGIAEQRVRLAGAAPGQGAMVRDMQQRGGAGLGYGVEENLSDMLAITKSVGSRGISQLPEVSKTARALGMERGEIIQSAGGLMRAGGAAPSEALGATKKIMTEAVAAGLDRAMITEFTQQVIGIQEQLLTLTGKNNAQEVARALGSFIRVSGEGKESFMRGPEMAGIRGLDTLMRGSARQAGGLPAGFMMRAFQQEGQNPLDQYTRTRQVMERGIFSGSAEDSVKNIKGIFSQAETEFGGPQMAEVNLADMTGMTIDQIRATKDLMAKIDKQGLTPEAAEELKGLQEVMKDPMTQLLDATKEQGRILASGVDKMVGGLTKVQEIENTLTQKAVEGLDNVASMFGMGSKEQIGAIKDFKDAVIPYLGLLGGLQAIQALGKGGALEGALGGGGAAAGAGKLGKLGKAGKFLGKMAGPLAMGMNTLDAVNLMSMNDEDQAKYLDEWTSQQKKKGVAGQALEGFLNPVDSIAAMGREINKDDWGGEPTSFTINGRKMTKQQVWNEANPTDARSGDRSVGGNRMRSNYVAPTKEMESPKFLPPSEDIRSIPRAPLVIEPERDRYPQSIAPTPPQQKPVTSSDRNERKSDEEMKQVMKEHAKALHENTAALKSRTYHVSSGSLRR